MPLTVNEDVRRAFELASLRREAKAVQSPRQWREVAGLQSRCQDARANEKELYAARYDARVEHRRRQLIDEAGASRRDLKPWWGGQDGFDPDATLRQAQRDVRAAHAGRIERIDDYERRKLKDFVERFRRDNALLGLARDGFERAADRRTGIERRMRQRDH